MKKSSRFLACMTLLYGPKYRFPFPFSMRRVMNTFGKSSPVTQIQG